MKRQNNSIVFNGIKYTVGDLLVSSNGYEYYVSIDDGRFGLIDEYFGTFCKLQNCDLSGYVNYGKPKKTIKS